MNSLWQMLETKNFLWDFITNWFCSLPKVANCFYLNKLQSWLIFCLQSPALSPLQVVGDVLHVAIENLSKLTRQRSTSKFLFRSTQGQVNSLGPRHHSFFNWRFECDCRHVSLLKLPNVRLQPAKVSKTTNCKWIAIVRTLREDEPLRLLLNLLFYHFNHSEPTYKSQHKELPDVIAACNQLNVNSLN